MVVGVVFDVDGTLVTFRFDVREARRALIEELVRQGFSTAGLDLATPIQSILDSARGESANGGGQSYDRLRKSAFAILDRLEVEGSDSAAVLPGVRSTLDALRSQGMRLAVLTNSGRAAASKVLSREGLLSRFEFTLTRDETETMKPNPDGLEMAAAKLGLAKASVCYVGDSPFDVRAARAAGVKSVSVATGNHTVERLKAEGADFAISSMSELPGVLVSWSNNRGG